MLLQKVYKSTEFNRKWISILNAPRKIFISINHEKYTHLPPFLHVTFSHSLILWEQSMPVNPGWQAQNDKLSLSSDIQIPSFKQTTSLKQSSLSVSQLTPSYLLEHTHVNPFTWKKKNSIIRILFSKILRVKKNVKFMLPFFKYRPSSIKSFKVTCDCYRYYFQNSTGSQCDFTIATNDHSHSGDQTSDSFISSHYDFQVTVTFKLHCKITMTDFLVICNLLQNAASTSQRRLCWQQKLHLCHSASTFWSHLDHDVIRMVQYLQEVSNHLLNL